MIFAKLDVCFWRHKKFRRAGLEAAAYWAGVLAYLREDESEDGVIEFDVLGDPLGVGDRKARQLAEHLVEVELFGRHDRGYVLLGYATKNETREQIEARRTASRDRQENWRREHGILPRKHGKSEANRDVSHAQPSGVVTTNVTRDTRVTHEEVPDLSRVTTGSDSLSLSGSASEGEPEREPPERTISPGDRITPELTAIAELASVQDIRGAWAKYTGHYAGKWVHVAGMWQKWCVVEAKRERTERDRDRNSGTANGNPYDGPAVRAERKRRDADRKETRRNAVPAPVADLLAAIAPKKGTQ